MKCYFCETELIWGGDLELDDDDVFEMETNLSCPKCKAQVLTFLPKDEVNNESTRLN